MDQIDSIGNIFHQIFQRIFHYIRSFPNIIQTQFSYFFEKSTDSHEEELNDQLFPIYEQIGVDLLALYVIFLILGIIVVLSLGHYEVSQPCINFATPEIHTPLVDFTTEEIHYQNSLYELSNINHTWVDSIAEPEQISPQRIYFYQPKSSNNCSIETLSRHSQISIGSTQSQQFQVKDKDPVYQSPPNIVNEWLIRRTRSGQIYGKYPIQCK